MEQHSFLRYSVAVLLFLAVSTQGLHISPNYDKADKQLKVIEVRGPLMLHCDVRDAPTKVELEWTRNGVAVGADPLLTGRHTVYPAENKFIIEKPTGDDAGNFTCTVKGTKDSASFLVQGMIRTKLAAHTAVVEGEKLTLHCVVFGTDPEITWTIHDNATISETTNEHILKEDDNKIKNAMLIINDAKLSDRGNYTCEATNDVVRLMDRAPVQSTTYLRVKGKFAALWPFLGICAEVVVLCAIILIYEKRRNKAEMEESDTDQSPEQKSDHKDSSDVRQRK